MISVDRQHWMARCLYFPASSLTISHGWLGHTVTQRSWRVCFCELSDVSWSMDSSMLAPLQALLPAESVSNYTNPIHLLCRAKSWETSVVCWPRLINEPPTIIKCERQSAEFSGLGSWVGCVEEYHSQAYPLKYLFYKPVVSKSTFLTNLDEFACLSLPLWLSKQCCLLPVTTSLHGALRLILYSLCMFLFVYLLLYLCWCKCHVLVRHS